MIGDNKEVFYNEYCPTCKFEDVEENDPEGPCCDCLDCPVNQDSHKPVNWKEKD